MHNIYVKGYRYGITEIPVNLIKKKIYVKWNQPYKTEIYVTEFQNLYIKENQKLEIKISSFSDKSFQVPGVIDKCQK